ncbi:hypothetical protein SteCoe_16316 [Stentor coeruleus]|uniref:Flavin-containing monooxygenase n=1 Tax=Stentor coeruleus TaxID=5963 RepID=A0A1R2C1V3_9CILI|nr:hypothetical protein SteCoe_16316 [Stentor coeruleus]
MEVCIIGGGWLGISAAKVCIENNCRPTVLCRDPSFGGIWQGFPNRIGVWDSLTMNTNKYQSSFSDMLWNSSDPIFPSAKQCLNYLSDYVAKHNLLPYFSFNSEVKSLSHEGEQYRVTWTLNGETHSKTYSHVVVAVGKCSKEIFNLQNPEVFTGNIVFGSKYREPSIFANKSVLCIGRSYTSPDIAYEALSTANSVSLLYARNYMLITKFYKQIPSEFVFSNVTEIEKNFPVIVDSECNKNNVRMALEMYENPSQYAPEWRIDTENLDDYTKMIVCSDEFYSALKNKQINLVKGSAKGFYEKGVILEDGTKIEAEVVVLGLGYGADYGFLSEEIKDIIRYDGDNSFLPCTLYRGMIHPNLPGLAFIGNFLSGTPGRYELQAEIGVRWAIGMLEVQEDDFIQGLRDEEFIRANEKKIGMIYPNTFFIKEEMRLLGLMLDKKFIGEELEFSKGPMLPQFFFLEKPGMKELCVEIVKEIKAKFSMHNFN